MQKHGINIEDFVRLGRRYLHAIHQAIKCMLIFPAARELTIEAAQGAGSARSFATRPVTRDLPFAQIKKLLDSRNDREILEGLRKVISVRENATMWPSTFSDVGSRR